MPKLARMYIVLGFNFEVANLWKIDEKISICKYATKHKVSLSSVLNILCTVLNSVLNDVNFKKKTLIKFSVKLKWNFKGFSAFYLEFKMKI